MSVRRIVAAAAPPEDGLLTLSEAAKYSGLGVEASMRRVADGDLPIERQGEGVRFRLVDVEKL